MITYTGGITNIEPVKTSYQAGEIIQFRVKGIATINRGALDYFATPLWSTIWKVFNSRNVVVGYDDRKHSIATWTSQDSGSDDFTINAGNATESGYYTITLSAVMSGDQPTVLDSLKVWIDVYGSPMVDVIPTDPPEQTVWIPEDPDSWETGGTVSTDPYSVPEGHVVVGINPDGSLITAPAESAGAGAEVTTAGFDLKKLFGNLDYRLVLGGVAVIALAALFIPGGKSKK